MLRLNDRDQAMLGGDFGPAAQMAMRILSTMAAAYDAQHMLDIVSAHVDGCLYHGDSGIDFAEKLLAGGARVTVPTTLNVGAIDLLHPENFQGSAEQAAKARRLMSLYQEMGCLPIWTCAPYQVSQRPPFGAQIAWAESNAIVFANSVLGARTNRYGDFIDICAAITGRVPAVGLHLKENRCGQILFELTDIPERLLHDDVLFPVLGYLVGQLARSRIPVITGLPSAVKEDQLKALGASAATSGAVALFHAVGITPEADTLDLAFCGRFPEEKIDVDLGLLKKTLGELSTVPDGKIDVVALGSPHYSIDEFDTLLKGLDGQRMDPAVQFIVCTNRLVWFELQKRGWLDRLQSVGIEVVVDTCVVVAPLVRAKGGVLMTNSGKFAHYAPGNIGYQVVFGSLEECIRSAEIGRVWRDQRLWGSG